jgi:hypothetical protein
VFYWQSRRQILVEHALQAAMIHRPVYGKNLWLESRALEVIAETVSGAIRDPDYPGWIFAPASRILHDRLNLAFQPIFPLLVDLPKANAVNRSVVIFAVALDVSGLVVRPRSHRRARFRMGWKRGG